MNPCEKAASAAPEAIFGPSRYQMTCGPSNGPSRASQHATKKQRLVEES